MKLKKLIPTLKGYNQTKYYLFVADDHFIHDIDKKYYNYKVYEICTRYKHEVIITIYKDKNKMARIISKDQEKLLALSKDLYKAVRRIQNGQRL